MAIEPTYVFFDVEIASFHDPQLLQIGAKCEGKLFSCYVRPRTKKPRMATAIHGITYVKGKLYKDAMQVKSAPLHHALYLFWDFLKSFGKDCILVGHNIIFHAYVLVKGIIFYNMIDRYRSTVFGLADSYPVLKTVVKDVQNYKLKTLAEHFCISTHEMNDALVDVGILEKVFVLAGGTTDKLRKTTKTFDLIVNRRKILDKKAANFVSLNILENVLSKQTRVKAAEAGISMGVLLHTFQTCGLDGLSYLFADVVFWRRRLKIVHKVGEFLEAHLKGNVCASCGAA